MPASINTTTAVMQIRSRIDLPRGELPLMCPHSNYSEALPDRRTTRPTNQPTDRPTDQVGLRVRARVRVPGRRGGRRWPKPKKTNRDKTSLEQHHFMRHVRGSLPARADSCTQAVQIRTSEYECHTIRPLHRSTRYLVGTAVPLYFDDVHIRT